MTFKNKSLCKENFPCFYKLGKCDYLYFLFSLENCIQSKAYFRHSNILLNPTQILNKRKSRLSDRCLLEKEHNKISRLWFNYNLLAFLYIYVDTSFHSLQNEHQRWLRNYLYRFAYDAMTFHFASQHRCRLRHPPHQPF